MNKFKIPKLNTKIDLRRLLQLKDVQHNNDMASVVPDDAPSTSNPTTVEVFARLRALELQMANKSPDISSSNSESDSGAVIAIEPR